MIYKIHKIINKMLKLFLQKYYPLIYYYSIPK